MISELLPFFFLLDIIDHPFLSNSLVPATTYSILCDLDSPLSLEMSHSIQIYPFLGVSYTWYTSLIYLFNILANELQMTKKFHPPLYTILSSVILAPPLSLEMSHSISFMVTSARLCLPLTLILWSPLFWSSIESRKNHFTPTNPVSLFKIKGYILGLERNINDILKE